MTSPTPSMLRSLLADQLTKASPDLLRGLLSRFIATLMSAEADVLCGAGYGERSEGRANRRNGYRHRDFDTRPEPSMWLSLSCGRAVISRTCYCSAATASGH
jgi:Transposase, Mutator family